MASTSGATFEAAPDACRQGWPARLTSPIKGPKSPWGKRRRESPESPPSQGEDCYCPCVRRDVPLGNRSRLPSRLRKGKKLYRGHHTRIHSSARFISCRRLADVPVYPRRLMLCLTRALTRSWKASVLASRRRCDRRHHPQSSQSRISGGQAFPERSGLVGGQMCQGGSKVLTDRCFLRTVARRRTRHLSAGSTDHPNARTPR